ncbi:MAG: RNA 2',3'-cyclic phosphodiesterase [Patescibacteria group bacterium]
MQEIKKKRIFIALNLPKDTKKEISNLIDSIRAQNQKIKWVREANLHLTLHFLGYLDNEQLEQVENIIEQLAGKFNEMNFNFDKFDAFPNFNQPKVIVLIGKQTNGNNVFSLQKLLGEKLKAADFSIDERPWKLHLTLGRVKDYNCSLKLPINFKAQVYDFKINTFELMESELMPEGPLYKVVKSYKL